MSWLTDFGLSTWNLTVEMAPWLLIGFAIAGVLGQLLPTRLVQEHLQKPGLSSVLKAVGLGVPLPLCSCGVIPVAAQLRRSGASRGSVAAFTIATPQTGVDSIAATYSLMGWPFTLGRLGANVFSGLVSGLAINGLHRRADEPPEAEEEEPIKPCCRNKAKETAAPSISRSQRIRNVLREGFITLPGDVGVALAIGIFIGGALGAWLPAGILAEYAGAGLLTYAAVTLLSVPLYVCATGSIPMAFGLVAAGLSPGAAMVFLIAGPATNAATLAALSKLIGKRETGIYLLTLVVTSWGTAFLFDRMAFPTHPETAHGSMSTGWLNQVAAIALVGLLVIVFYRKWDSKRTA